MTEKRSPLFWLVILVCLGLAAYVYRSSREAANSTNGPDVSLRPRLALIVGGSDDFWKQVIVGAKVATKEYDAELEVIEPDGTGAGQTEALVKIHPQDYDGLAISPLAPNSQTLIISKLATQMKVVTYDNDATNSLRHLYVGTNNVLAGQMAADLVARALPKGGQIALFVGDNERQNARDRRQAMINALRSQAYRGPSLESEEADKLAEPIEAGTFTIVATYLDQSDPQQALENAKQALQDNPNIAGMVALYGYNGPACLAALRDADKLEVVKLIAFDNHEATLAGVADGLIEGTVVQDPYRYGYESVDSLCKLCRGKPASIPVPGAGSIALACAVVDQENLAQYRENLSQRMETISP